MTLIHVKKSVKHILLFRWMEYCSKSRDCGGQKEEKPLLTNYNKMVYNDNRSTKTQLVNPVQT